VPLPESPMTAAESLLRCDRWVVASCLLLLCLLSWYYLFAGAGTGMSTVAMSTWQFPPPVYDSMGQGNWSPAYWGIMLLMWWVMMIAMMVPSAAPMIL
jgi:predicted metal-binding membrane protein